MASLQITDVTAAIADVVIPELDIYDFKDIPEQVDARARAQLFPDPELFITDLVVSNVTTGYNVARKNMDYKLNYVLAYKPIEAGRRINEYVPGMIEMIQTIVETLTTTDFSSAGAMRFDISVPFMGRVFDPAGNGYLGARIIIDVLELIQ